MSRRNVVQLDPSVGVSELHTTIDRMLLSGLLKVQPSPLSQEAADERFARLSETLATKGQGNA